MAHKRKIGTNILPYLHNRIDRSLILMLNFIGGCWFCCLACTELIQLEIHFMHKIYIFWFKILIRRWVEGEQGWVYMKKELLSKHCIVNGLHTINSVFKPFRTALVSFWLKQKSGSFKSNCTRFRPQIINQWAGSCLTLFFFKSPCKK